MKATVHNDVTRWAPEVLAALTRGGFKGLALLQAAALLLATMHRESRGGPGVVTGEAFGLVQHKPKFFPDVGAAPSAQLDGWVKVVKSQLKKTGGYLPTAALARDSGPAAVREWVETGEAVKGPWLVSSKGRPNGGHLQLIHETWTDLYPAYGAWLAGWLAAGSPSQSATVQIPSVTVSGQTLGGSFTVTLAKPGNHKGKGPPSPYDGRHRYGGKVRIYKEHKADAVPSGFGWLWWAVLAGVAVVAAAVTTVKISEVR